VTRRGRPSKGHALIAGPLAPCKERGLQPEGPAGIASARLLTPRNRFRAGMACPEIETIGTTWARNSQSPHLHLHAAKRIDGVTGT